LQQAHEYVAATRAAMAMRSSSLRYAALRIGSARLSGSRKPIAKGGSWGPSPVRPRGGEMALVHEGSIPKKASAGVAPRSP